MAAPSSAVAQAQAAAALAAEEQAAAAAAAGEEQPEAAAAAAAQAAAAAAAQAAAAAAAQVAAAAAVVVHPPPPPVNQNPEVNVGGDQPAVNFNAVLQQLLAGQQAQAVINANIAQQLEQLQQQQPPAAAPFAGQFLAEPAGGVLHPLPVIGGVPLPHPPAAAAPARAAAPAGLSEGAKLAAKLQANLWATDAATPKWFIIRGGFHVGRVMNKERLTLATRKFALITDKAPSQISKLTDLAAEHFFTKMPDGVQPTAMPPQMHLTVAVQVLFAAIEAGMGGADALCTERVKSLHREFLAVESQLSAYLTHHFVELAPFPAKTRDTVLAAYNIGFNDFFHDLAARGEDLLQEHSTGPPTSASVISMESPKFTKLKNLIKEEDSNSLVARSKLWSAEKTAPPTPAAASAAAASAGKRKSSGGASSSAGTAKKRAPSSGVFFQPPDHVCRNWWFSTDCHRQVCSFEHIWGGAFGGAGGGQQRQQRRAPAQQPQNPQQPLQQPQLQPHPQQQQQQQQQQQPPAQAANGGGRGQQQRNVAHYSVMAGGGRGGGGGRGSANSGRGAGAGSGT